MLHKKKVHPTEKSILHIRNRHRQRYDFIKLIESCPELNSHIILNIYNDQTIDFSDPVAVKILNKALLKNFYNIDYWDIPENYLCPPIPGRADYIHYVADLLCNSNSGIIPVGNFIRCLDIGVGANCVYPIIGHKEYGWSFVGTDIDAISIDAASKIIESNTSLKDYVEIRKQNNSKDIYNGIIKPEERFHLSICNPPFHASFNDAQQGTRRKLNNLGKQKNSKFLLNFGGQDGELWCDGGEEQFIKNMINQSKTFSTSCYWFTSLVSKESHLKNIKLELDKVGVTEVKTIPMGQGNKISRIVAWTFLTPDQKKEWEFIKTD